MSNKRRVFFISGARSEYDLMVPVIQAVSKREELDAAVVPTAAHMSPFHGMGVEQIRNDGFAIAGTVESLVSSESWQARSLSFAHLIEGLSRFLSSNKPDLIFVAGDREEALAGALVGNFLRIPVAHLHGGDRCIASDIDEVLRPAISKLAHLHFTATEGHRERLIRMGESAEHVWSCGAPGLDRLRDEPELGNEIFLEQYGVDVSKPFFILVQHPSPTLNGSGSNDEMKEVLDGVLSLEAPVFCSYPNSDPGNVGMRKAIDAAKTARKNLVVYHSLPRSQFVNLYRRCAAIVGNSSSIVIESSFLRVPGVLVGRRQDFRELSSNVLKVEAKADAIAAACRRALDDPNFKETVRQCQSLYGDGHAASRIADVLANIELKQELLLKTMPY